MNKSIILLTLSLLFSFITVCGAGYVLLARGEKNAGYAVIPMVISILFTLLWRKNRYSASTLQSDFKS